MVPIFHYNTGATIKDMHEYAIPSMRYNPNLIALHAGTNDLRSIKSVASSLGKTIDHLRKNDKKLIIIIIFQTYQ